MGERRAAPRAAWGGPAEARVGHARAQCVGVDLSTCGMQVVATWRPTPGQPAWVNFEVGDRVVEARGVVVWSAATGPRYRWGIRFTALHRSCSDAIAQYVGSGALYEEEPPTQRWTRAQAERNPTISGHTQIADIGHFASGPIAIGEAEPSTQISVLDHSGPFPVGIPGIDDPSGPLPVTVPFGATQVASVEPPPRERRATLVDLPGSYVGPAPSAPISVHDDPPQDVPTAVTSVAEPPDASTGIHGVPATVDRAPTLVNEVVADADPPTAVRSLPAIDDAKPTAAYEAVPPEEPPTTVTPPAPHGRAPRHPTSDEKTAKRRRVEAILATTRRRSPADQRAGKASDTSATLNRATAPASAGDESQQLLDLYREALKDLV
ncbi:MAG: PilZ domain-containing protein [Myxococcota bacterium]